MEPQRPNGSNIKYAWASWESTEISSRRLRTFFCSIREAMDRGERVHISAKTSAVHPNRMLSYRVASITEGSDWVFTSGGRWRAECARAPPLLEAGGSATKTHPPPKHPPPKHPPPKHPPPKQPPPTHPPPKQGFAAADKEDVGLPQGGITGLLRSIRFGGAHCPQVFPSSSSFSEEHSSQDPNPTSIFTSPTSFSSLVTRSRDKHPSILPAPAPSVWRLAPEAGTPPPQPAPSLLCSQEEAASCRGGDQHSPPRHHAQ
ncbi:hypothetical protein GWK47_042916 [Chionoecetes opilio]|uniref:Uncharacterized protein n=1 Tax=Chionoecetes opilio TaxID=41210 RepID=A0A8J4YMI0_CHIOP|nr:hypothetical protein GWK47_042916 [Chionoecetes opilio]